jgi:hypothetical protein
MEGRCGLPAVAVALLAGVAGCGGSITAAQTKTVYLTANGGPSGSVTAQVQVYDPNALPQVTCGPPLNAGACQLLTCLLGPGLDRDPDPGYGDLGTISAAVDTTTEPLTYGGAGYPTVTFPAPIALGTGGIMTFSGGDGVSAPTFDVSATIPDVGVITEPVNAEGGSSAIVDTSQDLSVSWMPISVGEIRFAINGVPASGPGGLALTCGFAGASGAGVVPKGLLSSMKGMAGNGGTLYGSLTAELETTSELPGLTVVTESYQISPTVDSNFEVTFQ